MAKKVKVSPLIRMLAEIAVDDEIAAQERLAKDPKAVKRVTGKFGGRSGDFPVKQGKTGNFFKNSLIGPRICR